MFSRTKGRVVKAFKHTRESGFTLIEIAIALVVLAVGLIGILALFPVGFDASARSSQITTATLLGQQVLEGIKAEGFDGDIIQTVAGGTAIEDEVFLDPYGYYQYTVEVTDGLYDMDAAARVLTGKIFEVVVTVEWPAGESDPRYIELRTYISDFTIQ